MHEFHMYRVESWVDSDGLFVRAVAAAERVKAKVADGILAATAAVAVFAGSATIPEAVAAVPVVATVATKTFHAQETARLRSEISELREKVRSRNYDDVDPELLGLARKARAAATARQDEDPETWARRLITSQFR